MRFDKRPSKKSKSGYTWRVTLEYSDEYGKTRRYSKSGFPTKKAAEIHGRQMQADLDKGVRPEAKEKTVNDVFEEWMAITKLSRGTIVTYASAYHKHVLPELGSMPVKKITFPVLQAFASKVSSKKKCSVGSVHAVIRQIGMLSLKSGYTASWPGDLVEWSVQDRSRDRQNEYIDASSFEMLVSSVCEKEDFLNYSIAMMLLIGYYSGLRLAEIIALTFDDIDLQKGILSVKRQLVYANLNRSEYWTTTKLKTAASKADIPIPAPLIKALTQWREYNPYSLLICREDGTWPLVRTVTDRVRVCARTMGIDFHFHALRHTYITNLILSGADPKTASELARHADPKMTLKVYTEISQSRKEEAVRRAFDEADAPNLQA